MHALAALSLLASSAGIVAAQQETYASFAPLAESFPSSPLEARQDQRCAAVGGKACGTRCIQVSYSCCGGGAGACAIGYVCGIAANDIWGCCPIGKRCRGDAPEPSTTIIGGGGSRPTSTVDDDDVPTSAAPAPTTTTRRLTPAATPAPTTALGSADEPVLSPTQTAAVPTNVVGGGNGGGNGGSTTTSAIVGGGNAPVSSAGMVGVSLAGIAGGLIVAIASLF